MSRLLLVEDDASLAQSLTQFLTREGFSVSWAAHLGDAEMRLSEKPDALILDWMLPDGQGVDWLARLRERKLGLPVILLTGRAELVDRVLGLESGANDYVTKPFEPRELLARIRVQLRHRRGAPGAAPGVVEVLQHAEIRLEPEARRVYFRELPIEFTRMEFDLLRLLMSVPGKVFSREELLNRVWGYENFSCTRTVDTHILQLRHKLDDALFETVRGVGYRLRAGVWNR